MGLFTVLNSDEQPTSTTLITGKSSVIDVGAIYPLEAFNFDVNNPLKPTTMKKHVPFLLSLLSVMGLLAWTASVRAQCLPDNVTLHLPITFTASDLSDHSHPVNVTGATFVTGQDGGALSALGFAGTGQYATIPAHPAFEEMTDAFTISAWIYPTQHLSENAIISKLNGSNRNFVFRFQDAGKLHFHYTRPGGLTFVTTDNPVITLNQWQHVAVTWDGDKIRLYVDGVEVKEQTITDQGPTFQAAGSIRLGTLNFSSERMVGHMDHVQMRAFALPAEEIRCLEGPNVDPSQWDILNLPLDNSGDDISFNGNDANFYLVGVGTDRWGENAMAANFTGSGYAVVPNIPQYNVLSSAFTISAWIKPTTTAGTQAIISKAGAGRDIVLRIDGGKLTAHYYVTGYTWCTPLTATVNAGEWSHVACTWDGTTMAVYHNGEMLQSITPATPPSFGANDWSIGSLTPTASETFIGQIDDVKVLDVALNVCELRSDIHPYENLLQEETLFLCEGQSTTLTAPAGYCTYHWVNDGSDAESFVVDANDYAIGDHQVVLEMYDYYDHLYTDTVELSVSLCTGVEEENQPNTMTLYPNPTSKIVTVKAPNLAEVQLLDIAGRFLESTTASDLKETAVDVSGLPAGVYFINGIRKDGTVLSERLIKH